MTARISCHLSDKEKKIRDGIVIRVQRIIYMYVFSIYSRVFVHMNFNSHKENVQIPRIARQE